jgi:hypothetical protein
MFNHDEGITGGESKPTFSMLEAVKDYHEDILLGDNGKRLKKPRGYARFMRRSAKFLHTVTLQEAMKVAGERQKAHGKINNFLTDRRVIFAKGRGRRAVDPGKSDRGDRRPLGR